VAGGGFRAGRLALLAVLAVVAVSPDVDPVAKSTGADSAAETSRERLISLPLRIRHEAAAVNARDMAQWDNISIFRVVTTGMRGRKWGMCGRGPDIRVLWPTHPVWFRGRGVGRTGVAGRMG
jgi:hypothetical protein